MKGHKPVLWSQGLFLHPQHFQALDAATTAQIDLLRLYGMPYFWGVRRIIFNHAFTGNSIQIERLEAVFPSGAALNVPFDAPLAPLALDNTWPAPGTVATLYVGLALPNSEGGNATMQQSIVDNSNKEHSTNSGVGTRFVYSEEPTYMPDVYGHAAPVPVQTLHFAPLLIRDKDLEHYSNYECLPIARVHRKGDSVDIDTSFVPPMLCMDGSPRLNTVVQNVIDAALACSGRLVGYKSAVSNDIPDMRFVLNFTALGILNRFIPQIHHIRSAQHTHPWHVYGILRIFAGELSSFFDGIDCLGREDLTISAHNPHGDDTLEYNHMAPTECFETLCTRIIQLMNDLGIDASKTLPLIWNAPYFMADVPIDFLSPSCQYWLCVRADTLTEEITQSLPRIAKLGAQESLRLIITKAVSGVPLQKIPTPPPGFLRRADTAWYAIDHAHPLWQHIVEQKKISLFWEHAPQEVDVRIISTGR